MILNDVLQLLHETASVETLSPYWDESMQQLPAGTPDFLQAEQIAQNRQWCGFGPEVDTPLQELATKIHTSPALLRLAWHCHQLLYEHPEYDQIGKWPALHDALGHVNGAFYLLVALAMVPRVRAVHRSMDIPEEITRDTCHQVWCFASNYRRATGGRLGIPLSQIYWLRHYTAGELFRLGRMEYMLRPFGGTVQVFRRKQTGEVIALAPDGMRYNGAGYVDGAGGITDTEHGWTATFTDNNQIVAGYPISPYGYAIHREVHLPKQEWECVLQKGDTMLEMHIPAGGGMTLDKCGDSMRRATHFFRQHFADRPFKAITCGSWIFNTQIQELQLSSDNLARFQRELYLYPIRSSGQDGLWFIFLQDTFDLATAPRETSLQKAVAAYLEQGHVWRGGGMFFLTEHLDEFGTQYYRRMAETNALLKK